MLIDPWLDESTTEWPFPLDEIDQCDYLILSHIHGDHADSVKRIQDKFGRFPTIVPSDSVRTLCEWQNVDLCSIYRAFPNMTYTWDDVKVDIYQGRHTETNGAYATDAEKLAAGGQSASGWYGQADLYSYLITCADGTKILIWAGMTTEEQKNLFEGVQPDIAVTHLSPKHDLKLYAEMIKAWGPKVVIPHHYDAIPSIFLAWNEEQVAKNTTDYSRPYVDDEIGFNIEGYVNELNSYIQAVAPNAQVLIPNHHQWYKFGFGYYTDISAK